MIGYELHSDEKRCERKFIFLYLPTELLSIISDLFSLIRMHQIYLILDACGGLIDTSNGTITSPSFPDLYPANKNCIWEILAPPQWRITVNFTHFDIEGNNVCIIEYQ